MNTLTPLHSFLSWEKETPENIFLRQPINNHWHVYTYRQAGEEVRSVASALRQLNLPSHSNIAILSKNCAHWLLADLAIMMAGHVSVPIYPTLSADGIKQILDHSECKVIFLGKLEAYHNQKDAINSQLIKISFPFYGPSEGLTWQTIIKEHIPVTDITLPATDQVATIMYSSGTTGTPKGVMLSFGAFGVVGDCVKENLSITKPEKFFSYLPLSHIAERALMQMVALASGSTISFAESLDTFSQNLQHEKPTIFGGVPRIYAKFQEGILNKLPQAKLDTLLSVPIVSTIIRNILRKKLGLSQARIIVSGAAPTPVSLLKWFKKIGIEIREIYGMTENTALSHANYKDVIIGAVGQPWPGVDVRISDEGEILIKHRALMVAYYKDEETTKAVFTADGFLKTGDIGEIDSNGFLTITGRLKDQFKTDKAKFIAPAPIELKLLSNTDIEQACVVGMGIPQPIALLVLSAKGKRKSKSEIEQSISDTIKNTNLTLEHYEHLEKAVIMKDEWTLENGLLTPSLKLKRGEVEKIYLCTYADWYRQEKQVIWEYYS